MLNKIWFSFFLIAAISLVTQLISGNSEILNTMSFQMLGSAKTASDLSLGFIGMLALWMGLMRLGEASGVVKLISKLMEPVLSRLMPEIPKGHKAFGSITMNFTANVLGLDNAATPLGIKAMQDMQELNPQKDTATNAQILFLVLNTSSLTLVPITIFLLRKQLGAEHPADLFLPILLATFCSSFIGLTIVCIGQKIPILKSMLCIYALAIASIVVTCGFYLSHLTSEKLNSISNNLGNGLLLLLILSFIIIAHFKKVNVYEEFIEGAKGGFKQAIAILPYLLAMLFAISALRYSGALEYMLNGARYLFGLFNIDTRFVDALPTAIMKPLSGSGARAAMLEAMQNYGVDSFVGRMSAIINGSTETTCYVLAVYFGAVGIKNGRNALAYGLAADVAGIISGILIGYWFYGNLTH